MQRLKNLENVCYRKRYKEIYRLLFTADLDEVSDHSNWQKKNPGYVEKNRPLWIIAESTILNKRIWITEDFGELEIATATLNIDVKTREYSESFLHKPCKTQKEMNKYLKELLRPCMK